MDQGNQKAKVGLFVLVATALAAFGVLKLEDVQFGKTYAVNVYFDDVAGIAKKSPVKIAGVEIGRVREIFLEQGKARVELALREGVVLHKDARAYVASTGIIGTKYLELSQGSIAKGQLQEGDIIPGFSALGLEQSVTQTLESMKGLADSLRGPKGGELGGNINSMVANLNAVTLSLREVLEDRKNDLSAALLSMRHITGALSNILEKSDRILAKVEKGDGAVGALLVDQKISDEVRNSSSYLREASAGAAEMFGRFTRFRAHWDYQYRFDAKAQVGRSDLGLRLSPRSGKHYFLGISNFGDSGSPLKVNDFEKRNTLNLGMGKEVTPWLDLYGGLIRSEGGFGARWRPISEGPLARRISVEAEAYGLGRDTTINDRRLQGPHYNLGLSADLFPWLRLTGRAEDIKETKHFLGGLNMTFEDKDLAYLLGLVTLTR